MRGYSEYRNTKPVLPFVEILPIALSTRAVVVGADRSLKVEEDQPRELKYSNILEKLGTPDFQTEEVYRLILREMTLIIIDIRACQNDPNADAFRRNCQETLRALRTVAKQVSKIDQDRHLDVLNFEGPKFQYVLKELCNYFEQAALKALGKDSNGMVKRIMMELRDILAKEDEELRRNTEKIR
jgi:hypothetical protein